MSGFTGRRRSLKGLFVNGVWHCDCDPRKPTVHFEVRKKGPNKGKWFRICQKPQSDKTRCKFFLWDADAQKREEAALVNISRTKSCIIPTTPSKRQSSPSPPCAVEVSPSGPSRKRSRAVSEDIDDDDDDDEYGFEQTDSSFNDELNQVLVAVETPNKAIKTSTFSTPATRRKLPWKMDRPSIGSIGLQTPQTDRRVGGDPFNTRFSVPSGALPPLRFNRQDDDTRHITTPSSSLGTPTSNHFINVEGNDLVRDVLGLLQKANVQLDIDTTDDLKLLLSKHANSAESYKRGRDVLRATVKAKDAKITELTYRASTLEAELEAEKAMVKHLQWEAQTGLQPDS